MPAPLPSIKIIDNKKVSLTEPEYACYQQICQSYNRANFEGSDLFKGLFETDNKGIITFIRPPAERYTSLEVYLFVCSLHLEQQIREQNKTVEKLVAKYEQKLADLSAKLEEKQ